MSDANDRLYHIAEAHAGYFTARQAVDAGMDRATLRHHARPNGRYQRVQRGLYRLRQFPSSPHEHVMAAWLPLSSAGAVVSHASALELYGISDIIPSFVHVSVPRAKRGLRSRAGVRAHTLEAPLKASEVRQVAGVQVTSPERTLIDALEDGIQPEQVELGIRQALDRGLTTPRRLRESAAKRSARIRAAIEDAVERGTA